MDASAQTIDEHVHELEHLYRTAPVGLCLMDRDLRYVRINEVLAALHRLPVEEHAGKTLREVVPDVADKVEPIYRNVIESGEPVLGQEVQASMPIDPTHARRWLASFYPLKDGQGAVYAVSTVVQDVTALKEAEERLGESEERFRLLLETAPDAIVLVRDDGTIALVNGQTEQQFGYPRDELIGQPISVLVPDRIRGLHKALRDGYRAAPDQRFMGWGLQLFGRRKDGSEFPVEINLRPIETEGGVLVTSIIRDISERVQTENVLRDLSGRLINAQEDERSRIARELHDDLSQRLALLAVELEQIGRELPEGCTGLGERVKDLLRHTGELSSDVHRLSYQLHPSKLDHLGLVAALKTYCEELSSRQGIKIELDHKAIPRSLRPDIALCLYRIAQEALRNVVRHSGAKAARVVLSRHEDRIHLTVSDRGTGFDPESIAQTGLGLISMRERLRLVGGEVSIASQPSQGTRVEARVPLAYPTA